MLDEQQDQRQHGGLANEVSTLASQEAATDDEPTCNGLVDSKWLYGTLEVGMEILERDQASGSVVSLKEASEVLRRMAEGFKQMAESFKEELQQHDNC